MTPVIWAKAVRLWAVAAVGGGWREAGGGRLAVRGIRLQAGLFEQAGGGRRAAGGPEEVRGIRLQPDFERPICATLPSQLEDPCHEPALPPLPS
jgi:hypothetical protein